MTGPYTASAVAFALAVTSAAMAQVVDTEEEFLARVAAYTTLRAAVERELPPLPDAAEPKQIESHKQQLRASLGRARADVERGEIFTPEAETLIRQRLEAATHTEDGAPRAAIDEDNPGRRAIQVNGDYPAAAQLSTVPPQVLLALPRLPDEEVEYRFMGRRLVLLDARARMIIDYMENALP